MAYITGIIGMRLPESALVVWWAFIKSKKDAKIEDGRRGGWCCAAGDPARAIPHYCLLMVV